MFNSRKFTARYPDRPWVKPRRSQSLPAFLWDMFKTLFWGFAVLFVAIVVFLAVTGYQFPALP